VRRPARSSCPAWTLPRRFRPCCPLDVLELEVGYGLIPLVDEEQNGNLLARIRSIRRQFALDVGVIIPSLHLRDNLQLKPGEYSVAIKGNRVGSAEIMIDHCLAMDPGMPSTGSAASKQGSRPSISPLSGCPRPRRKRP
jgi:flagellar biosynthesis protein FlhA